MTELSTAIDIRTRKSLFILMFESELVKRLMNRSIKGLYFAIITTPGYLYS